LNLLRQAAHGKSAYLALYDTQAVELDTEEAMIEHIRRCVEMFNSADGGFIAQYYLGEGEQEFRYVEHGLRILEFYKEIINATT